MRSISFTFRVSPSTVSGIIRETCTVIWKFLKPEVFKPLTREMWEEVATNFENDWNFPLCVGAIDGKHCCVQAFSNSGSEWYNYKGTYSIVLLGVSDARYKFLVVDIGTRGRRSDGGVLRNSNFGKCLDTEDLDLPPPRTLPGMNEAVPYVFVGEEAFPLKRNLMRPFPGSFLPSEQIIFNYRVSRARSAVENAFGILVARWRILKKSFQASYPTTKAIIQATVCLHNYLVEIESNYRHGNRRYIPPRFVDAYTADGSVIPGQRRDAAGDGQLQPLPPDIRMGTHNFIAEAAQVRETIVDYFLGNGQVY